MQQKMRELLKYHRLVFLARNKGMNLSVQTHAYFCFKSHSTLDRLIRFKKPVTRRCFMRKLMHFVVIVLLASFFTLDFCQLATAQEQAQEQQAVLHGYQKAPQPISD